MPSLGNDLAKIRKKRGLSLEEVQQSTKIPVRIITSIEDNSIFDGMSKGDIYIRSYVRSYAKALAIEDKKIIYALNKVEINNYSGSLIVDDKPGAEPEINAEDKDEQPDTTDDEPDALPEEIPQNPPSTPEKSALHPKEVSSIDWANLGSQFQPARTSESGNKIIFAIAVILLVVAALLAYWFFFSTGSSANFGARSGDVLPAQTTASPDPSYPNAVPLTSSDQNEPMGDDLTSGGLPDTLSIVVYAAYGKLEPIRIYTDIADELNPYWIQQGEAIKFKFVNDFQFRGGLDSVILLMNGHRISNIEEQFYNAQTGRVEIPRSFFENESKWLLPPPDTLDIDVPPPSVIYQPEH